ncbi:MAG: alpha/beta hydrolase [Ignavibacteriales bacterium]|nr:alpha/beta hydrolase [Ignavibacteriales bacterium]
MVPLRELTVRRSKRGWGLRAKVEPADDFGPEPDVLHPLILFVHGYNNSQEVAKRAYGDFVELLKKKLDKATLNNIWWFYWPGSISIPVASAASYPLQIRNARRSGEMLAVYLQKLMQESKPPQPIVLVAHSLGSRVALETLNKLVDLESEYLHRLQVCIMAAAVQVDALEKRGKFLKAIEEIDRRFALFSSYDAVLKYAFKAGQTAALEGFMPEAVGSHGNPAGIWSIPEDDTLLKHGEYWSDKISAERVAFYLGKTVSKSLRVYRTPVNEISKRGVGQQPEEDIGA